MTPDKRSKGYDNLRIAEAFAVLKQAYQTEPTYAWEWQCELADSQRQAGVDPKNAHQGAAHFLHKHFGIDATAMQEYQDLMHAWR
jgi:hypothetical protein